MRAKGKGEADDDERYVAGAVHWCTGAQHNNRGLVRSTEYRTVAVRSARAQAEAHEALRGVSVERRGEERK